MHLAMPPLELESKRKSDVEHSKMTPVSKGKWLPGSLKSLRESHGYGYSFYCEVCDRAFPTQAGFEKHNQTEMHFKRMSKSFGNNGHENNELDLLGDNDRLPNQRSRRNIEVKNYSFQKAKKNGVVSQTRCPTCFALFNKNMMGKHLLSYFHCQKSERADRKVDPEKTLILENIHSIVTLSPYQCKPCKFYFNQRSQLLDHFAKEHVREHTEKSNVGWGWICSACTTGVTDSTGMLCHLRDSEEHAKMEAAIQKSIPIIVKDVRLRKCKFCSKFFLLRRELFSHQLNCSLQKSVSRKDRENKLRVAVDADSLNSEAKTDPSNDRARSGEEEVVGTFRKSERLSKNATQPRLDPVKIPECNYKCDQCDFISNSKCHLFRHSKIHADDRIKEFSCEICGRGFYEKFQLNFHLKIHTGKTVMCDFPGCSYRGRSLSEVKSHAISHQSGDDFKCDKCEYKTASKSHYRRHQLVHEKSQKKFGCKLCSYETNLLNGLKRHELTHEETKSFKCPYCDYTAKNLETLRTHVLKRKLHSDATLYTCSVCNGESPYRTNKYAEFKSHVQLQHPKENSNDQSIYVIAGLRKL